MTMFARVTSTDGMTADSYAFPQELLARVAIGIINEVRSINHVAHAVRSKPTSAIESG